MTNGESSRPTWSGSHPYPSPTFQRTRAGHAIKILAISPAFPAISALLDPRVNNPLRSLQRQQLIDGFTTIGLTTDPLQNIDCSFDVVLIQRAVPERIYLTLAKMGVPFVQDVDDNLLAEAAYRVGWSAETSLITGLRYAKVVSAPTNRLIGLLEKYSKLPLARKAVITPNALPYPREPRPASKPSRLLWVQGEVAAMTTRREEVVRAVDDFSRRYQLPVVLIGRNVIDPPCLTHPVSIGEIDFQALTQFLEFSPTAIGVAPLETKADQGTLDFIAGKSDIKMLFFDGYGHPGVYSAAPPYMDSPLQPGARMVGNSYGEWRDALEYQYQEGWRSIPERARQIREVRHIDRVARDCWWPGLEAGRLAKSVAAADLHEAFGASQPEAFTTHPDHKYPADSSRAIMVPFETETCRLERELACLRNSLSWRITAPLRKLTKPLLGRKSRA